MIISKVKKKEEERKKGGGNYIQLSIESHSVGIQQKPFYLIQSNQRGKQKKNFFKSLQTYRIRKQTVGTQLLAWSEVGCRDNEDMRICRISLLCLVFPPCSFKGWGSIKARTLGNFIKTHEKKPTERIFIGLIITYMAIELIIKDTILLGTLALRTSVDLKTWNI